MGLGSNTYLDFAENDYDFFRSAYDSGNKGSALASIGQNICERYLKHIISEYAKPENDQEQFKKERAPRTHNLHILIRYLRDDMGISVPEETEDKLDKINGFYFSTRYPGDDSFIASERDVDKASDAVESARKFTLEVCREMETNQTAN